MSNINQFRHINLTTLQLLIAVWEEGTLTRAAAREGIAPSAVSKRLAELEQTLGVVLFERQPKGMVVTPAGETMLHYARTMLLNAEHIAMELTEHASGARGFVRMFANLSAIVQFLPEDFRSFLSKHGAIKIHLEEKPSGGVVSGVELGLAEIGICSSDVETKDLRRLAYRSDRLVVVMRSDNPLAKRKSLPFRDTLDENHIGLHVASSIYTRTLIEARLAGKPLRLRIHVPGFDAVCRMAQTGMGIGIIPEGAFELLGKPMGLVASRLSDSWAKRELLIVARKGVLSPVGALLVEHLQAVAP